MIEFIRLLESHKLIDTATVEKVVRRKSQLMAQVENVVRRAQAMDLTGLNQVSDLVNHVSVWLDAIHLTDDLEETRRVEYGTRSRIDALRRTIISSTVPYPLFSGVGRVYAVLTRLLSQRDLSVMTHRRDAKQYTVQWCTSVD